jgi:DNA-directed RNA polymerase subunit F
MDKQLTTEPEKLKKFIDESTSIEQINEETIAAVVEACFRLALHPETSRNEAITYLKRAYKIVNEFSAFVTGY